MSSLQPISTLKSITVEYSKKQAEQVVTSVSTTVRGNCADGNSTQINGSVAGLMVYCHNLFIINNSSGLPPAASSKQARLPNPVIDSEDLRGERKSLASDQQSINGSLRYGDNRPRYVNLYSKAGTKIAKARAKYHPRVRGNWIDRRIVTRALLQPLRDTSMRQAQLDGNIITSNGQFVDFACAEAEEGDRYRHRFYVVEHSSFDVLFGSDFNGMNRNTSP